ncbi:zinc finger protein 638, partial [Homo sapiens]
MPRDGVPAGNTTPAAAQAAAQSPDSATAGAPQVLDSLKRYPDWNPEILPSRRNEGNRKENETPRRRSHSPSPRRSRRSSSSHRFRRSRSPMHYMYRPRSRSPRICHRFISRYRSRSRSRSPYRIRNPFRGSPKCFRSVSPERMSRRSVRSSDRKKALEDVVQRSGHGTEFN